MQIDLVPVDLKLQQSFATSRSSTTRSRSYFLKYGNGVGEATPVRFYGETPETLEAAWPSLSKRVESVDLSPQELWQKLDRALGYQYALKCGIDLLTWDRLGQLEGATVRELANIPAHEPVATAFSIGINPADVMQVAVRRRPDFRVYKIKVGFDGDIDAVAAVRQVTQVPLYLDANGGWTVEEAAQKLPVLERMGAVLCEQPIFSGVRAHWDYVRASTSMPVIVDEHCQRAEHVGHWAGWVDGINVKLQKCGGITPALEIIKRARDEGMRVMIGCMIESSVGIAAAAQLAPLADYVDLDSNLYLDFDPYEGISCERGLLLPSNRPGLGVWETERVSA